VKFEPLVSIIITSYNYSKYIEKAIDSCIEQDYLNKEIIIIDDGSTDETSKILDKYKNKVSVYLQNNQGLEKTANYGINISKGDYWVRLDADDYLDKNFLTEIVKEINKNFCFYYSNYKIVDSKNDILQNIKLPSFNKKEILSRGDFLASGTLVRKLSSFEVGLYNNNVYNCGLENYEFIIKLILNNNKGKHIKKNLWNYRQHNKSLSFKKRNEIIKFGYRLFKNYNLGNFKTNLNHPYKLKV